VESNQIESKMPPAKGNSTRELLEPKKLGQTDYGHTFTELPMNGTLGVKCSWLSASQELNNFQNNTDTVSNILVHRFVFLHVIYTKTSVSENSCP